MSESFHLSFSNAELELYNYLKRMKNASEFLKGCIKTHMSSSKDNFEMSGVDHYQAVNIKHLFNRVYGDILDYKDIKDFYMLCSIPGSTIRGVMTGRKKILMNVCQNDLILVDKVLEYAKTQLPTLGDYL